MSPAQGGRGDRRPFVAIALVAMFVAGCGTAGTASPPGPSSATPPPSIPGASEGPSPAGSDEPTPSEEATPREQPTGSPAEPPSGSPSTAPSTSPPPTSTPGSAAACAGNADNRDWFAGLARAVAWDVYCPALPAGWFVVSGSYRLAGSGKMTITYKGPAGQRIEILEGAYCGTTAGCPPTAPDAGPAAFGNRDGHLVDAGGGSWVVVTGDGDLDWQATGIGMDGPTLAGYTAAFVKVGE